MREILRNVKFVLSPAEHAAALSRALEGSAAITRVERFDAAIAGAAFTYYGHKPAITLYTKGEFVPTYSTISFTGWNNFVARRDLGKVAELKPRYAIFDVETIDNLYPPQNSPLLFRHILDNYRVVARGNGVFLMERIDGVPRSPAEMFSASALDRAFDGRFAFNPAGAHEIAFVDLDVGLPERLLSFFHKPAEYTAEMAFSDGTVRKYKTSADHLRMGLSNHYVFRSNDELLMASNDASSPLKLRSFMITCRNLFGACPATGRAYSKMLASPAYLVRSNPGLSEPRRTP